VTSSSSELGEYIDGHMDDLLGQATQFVNQTSCSVVDGLNPEVFRTANLLELYCRRLGCERVEQYQPDNGYPIVYAELMAQRPNAKWLLISCLYDVVPWDEDDWSVTPDRAEIHDSQDIQLPKEWGPVLTGRGTRNQKGPLTCVLFALDAMRRAGELPLNIMLVVEGEEEIASPHLSEFRDAYVTELSRASAAYLCNPIEDVAGRQQIFLGLRGLITLELTVRGGDWGGPAERSLFATDVAWVDNPAWRLVWALSTLKEPRTDRVLIDGFYDQARVWAPSDLALFKIATDEFDEAAVKTQLGIRKFRCGIPGTQGLEALMTQPLINIDGLVSGYLGANVKTSFPRDATAKLDIRLVPNMDYQNIVQLLRRHLDRQGYPEVEIQLRGGYNTSQTPAEAGIVQCAIASAEECGHESRMWPVYFASNPMVVWSEPPLRLPSVSAGIGKMGRPHMANEYFTIDGMRQYSYWLTRFFSIFAEWKELADGQRLESRID